MHLNSETALDLIDGHMQQEEQSFWAEHLEGCYSCTESLKQWRVMAVALRRSHLQSAPESDIQAAIRIFPPRPETAPSRLRRILAAVTFDSFFEPALAGARGLATDSRQLVLRAEDVDIHLKIWGEAGHRHLLGQLLSRTGGQCANARLDLLRQSEKLDTAFADESGEFRFTDLPEGELTLQVDLPNLTVVGVLDPAQ